MTEEAPVEGRPLEDAELALRAREGDDGGAYELVKRHGPDRVPCRVAGDP